MGGTHETHTLVTALLAVGVLLVALASHRTLLLHLSGATPGASTPLGLEQRRHEAAYSLFSTDLSLRNLLMATFSHTDAGRELRWGRGVEEPPRALPDFRFGNGSAVATEVIVWTMQWTPAMPQETYRPLVTASSLVTFFLTSAFSEQELTVGGAAAGQQLMNVFLHCCITVGVFVALRTLFKERKGCSDEQDLLDALLHATPAVAGAVFFAVLPAHVNSSYHASHSLFLLRQPWRSCIFSLSLSQVILFRPVVAAHDSLTFSHDLTLVSVIVEPYEGRAALLAFACLLGGSLLALDAGVPSRSLPRQGLAAAGAVVLLCSAPLCDERAMVCALLLCCLPFCYAKGGMSATFAAALLASLLTICCLLEATTLHSFVRYPIASERGALGSNGWAAALSLTAESIGGAWPFGQAIGIAPVATGIALIIAAQVYLRRGQEDDSSALRLAEVALGSAGAGFLCVAVLAFLPLGTVPYFILFIAQLILSFWMTAFVGALWRLVLLSGTSTTIKKALWTALGIVVVVLLIFVASTSAAVQEANSRGHAHRLHSVTVRGEDTDHEATEALVKHFLRRNSTLARLVSLRPTGHSLKC